MCSCFISDFLKQNFVRISSFHMLLCLFYTWLSPPPLLISGPVGFLFYQYTSNHKRTSGPHQPPPAARERKMMFLSTALTYIWQFLLMIFCCTTNNFLWCWQPYQHSKCVHYFSRWVCVQLLIMSRSAVWTREGNNNSLLLFECWMIIWLLLCRAVSDNQ